jgi:hypothetical protein
MAMARSTPAQKPRGLAKMTDLGWKVIGVGCMARAQKKWAVSGCRHPHPSPLPLSGEGTERRLLVDRFVAEKRRPQHDCGTDADGAVGDVKRGVIIIPRGPVDEDEVDHFAKPNAVYDVADGTSDDEGERELHAGIGLTVEPAPAPAADDYRERHKKPALPAACISQKTECGPRVVRQYPIEKRQDIASFAGLKLAVKVEFGDLVKDDHDQNQADPAAGSQGAHKVEPETLRRLGALCPPMRPP